MSELRDPPKVCERCKNRVFKTEPTGWGCVICGNFLFKDGCTIEELWRQFRINGQYCELDSWSRPELPIMKSWALIEELEPLCPQLFREYAVDVQSQ